MGKKIRKWEDLLPGEELAALKKVIIQLVFDMFHLESQVISDAYSGEKFGKGVYYRMVYGEENEAQKFEDIPVIFLTGRRDPESMIKVMPLKPAGYLIKSSKPADIKKEIDTFFEKKRA